MAGLADFNVAEKPQWCPGCGDHIILMGLKQALAELDKEPHETVVVSGIGCGSKLPHYIRTYGYEGIHGRLLPLAEGIKLANHKLTVVAVGGDGDGLSEGTNHFIHAVRRNNDVNYFVQDNFIYALTTGQVSPTTPKGRKTKTTLNGSYLEPLHPTAVALAAGATFVAATFAGDLMHMKTVMKKAIEHKGFAFVDIYQPCVTWNKNYSYDWYKERVYDLQKENHDTSDWKAAMDKAMEPYRTKYEKLPIGIFYQTDKNAAFYENLHPFADGPLVKQSFKRDLSKDFEQLM